MAAAVAMLTGCKDYDADVLIGAPVQVEMAYTFSNSAAGNQTRQADGVVTSDDTNPRLPQSIQIVPMMNDNPLLSDVSWEEPVLKPDDATPPTSQLYRSRYCNLVTGVNSCLVYGSVAPLTPPEGTDSKMYNGSLQEHFPYPILTVNNVKDGIWFSLEPIYKSTDYTETNGIPAEASALATCLNTITAVGGWTTSSSEFMKNILKKFTNNGYSLPGSAASVEAWIEAFIKLIGEYLDSNTHVEVSAEDKTLLETIRSVAVAQKDAITTTTDYPRNKNLPDGAAVLRWVQTADVGAFLPQISTTTLANINSVSRFAYPAALYYFVDSSIRTSDTKVDFETLYQTVNTDEAKTAWDKVLEHDEFSDPNHHTVTQNTRAVVLTYPIQYAVAQLQVRIKAAAGDLKDAVGADIPVGTENFPLRGIIVCGQHPVNYQFADKAVAQGSVSDADVLFIYDNQVKNCFLLPTAEGVWNEGCNTLVLQSHKNEDVNIILEFENNSGQDFECVDGMVYRGTRFYLIGKVEAARYNNGGGRVNDENSGQVFTKDYITTVNMTVTSLAKAYNVPPNLLSNNLEIGVVTTPDWIAATPTGIELEK